MSKEEYKDLIPDILDCKDDHELRVLLNSYYESRLASDGILTMDQSKNAILKGQSKYEYCILDKADIDVLEELVEKSFKDFLDTTDTCMIRIYEIIENINIPYKHSPTVCIGCGMGDKVIIINQRVYVRDWKHDHLFSVPAFDHKFIEINDKIFRPIS